MQKPRQDVTEFLLLTTIRSGSHFACSVLDSHPQVLMHGETLFYDYDFSPEREDNFYTRWQNRVAEDPAQITHRNMTAFAYRFIEEHLDQAEPGQAVGFDMKYDFWDRLQFVRDFFLAREPRPKVVHLVRANTLRMHISAFLLNCRNRGVKRGTVPIGEFEGLRKVGEGRVRITPNKTLLGILTFLEARKARFRALAAREFESLELTYEELAPPDRKDPGVFPEEPRRRLCAFLGLDPDAPMRTEMTKVNPYAMDSLIENFGEIRDLLGSLGLERYLA